MQKTADVVIVGAGVSGCSIAFHLVKLGVRDIVLLEKEPAAGQGSSAKANGGIRAQWSTEINIRLSNYSIPAFERFQEETGHSCGLLQAGYLFMTSTEAGESSLRRNYSIQQALGVPNRWLAPSMIAELAPYVNCEDLRAGTYSPKDGFIDPHGVVLGYLQAARSGGAALWTDSEALEIKRDEKGVAGVSTAAEFIATRCVVNAAGPYAGVLAEKSGTRIPVLPYKRMLACTEEIGGAPEVIPMTVDTDTGLLIRREGKGILFAYSDPNTPPGFETEFEAAFLEIISEKAWHRFPFTADAQISTKRCLAGLYPETPDHHAILGVSPDLAGYYLAAGFGGHGIMHAPATGRALAEIIVYGECRFMDIRPLRPERFVQGDLIVETTVL
jgi:sarcosine oxidase, subunit beta